MGSILAASAAVIVTYLFWAPLRKLSPGSVLLVSPFLEEGAKCLAWSFAAPIFPVQVLFGLAETSWELRRRKPGAAIAAVLTHSCFGLAAEWASSWGRIAALGAALALHFFLWNSFIYLLQLKRGI